MYVLANVAVKTYKLLQTISIHKPNLLKAPSTLFGLFVAAITMTCERCFKPSINVNNCDTIRLSTSP